MKYNLKYSTLASYFLKETLLFLYKNDSSNIPTCDFGKNNIDRWLGFKSI